LRILLKNCKAEPASNKKPILHKYQFQSAHNTGSVKLSEATLLRDTVCLNSKLAGMLMILTRILIEASDTTFRLLPKYPTLYILVYLLQVLLSPCAFPCKLYLHFPHLCSSCLLNSFATFHNATSPSCSIKHYLTTSSFIHPATHCTDYFAFHLARSSI